MMVRQVVFATVAAAVLCTGCTRRIYLSQSMRDGFEQGAGGPESDNDGTAALQYFASHRIVLERDVTSRNERIAGGRVVLRRGRLVERLIIRRGTPGIAQDWGKDWIAVSFEEGSQIVFSNTATSVAGVVAPASSDQYRVRTQPGPDGRPTVDFDGRGWYLASALHTATLQIKRNALGKKKRSRRVLRGRRLSQTQGASSL